MNLDLIAIRETLTAGLEDGGLTVYDHLPKQLHPPVVLIEPGEQYITDEADDIPFGSVAVNWVLYVIAKAGTPETQSLDLDALIVQTLGAIPEGWNIGTTGRPYQLTNGQLTWLASQVQVSFITRL